MSIRMLTAAACALALLASVAAAQDERQAMQPGAQMDALRGGGDFPKDAKTMSLIQRQIELGELGPIPPIFIPSTPRYLVTYMNSQTADAIRSATVVSVTNQSRGACRVSVSYYKGFSTNATPVCTTTFSITPDFTIDYCSRNVPGSITTCNSICAPALTFDEGRAIVSATCREIGVSGRVYYTAGNNDERLTTVTDSKIVQFGQGNAGD